MHTTARCSWLIHYTSSSVQPFPFSSIRVREDQISVKNGKNFTNFSVLPSRLSAENKTRRRFICFTFPSSSAKRSVFLPSPSCFLKRLIRTAFVSYWNLSYAYFLDHACLSVGSNYWIIILLRCYFDILICRLLVGHMAIVFCSLLRRRTVTLILLFDLSLLFPNMGFHWPKN